MFDRPSDDLEVRLMHWDARWRQEFEQTRSNLLWCCDGRVVQVLHIGATSVPGMIGRPVIDVIAVVADPMDLDEAAVCIEGLNFKRVQAAGWFASVTHRLVTLVKPRHGEMTHCVYLTTQGADLIEHACRLRDDLRNRSDAAMAFEQAKVDCWQASDGAIGRYGELMAELFDRQAG